MNTRRQDNFFRNENKTKGYSKYVASAMNIMRVPENSNVWYIDSGATSFEKSNFYEL